MFALSPLSPVISLRMRPFGTIPQQRNKTSPASNLFSDQNKLFPPDMCGIIFSHRLSIAFVFWLKPNDTMSRANSKVQSLKQGQDKQCLLLMFYGSSKIQSG